MNVSLSGAPFPARMDRVVGMVPVIPQMTILICYNSSSRSRRNRRRRWCPSAGCARSCAGLP